MCQWRASPRTVTARQIVKIPQRRWDAYQIIRTTLPNFSMDGGGWYLYLFKCSLKCGCRSKCMGTWKTFHRWPFSRASLRLIPPNWRSPSVRIYAANTANMAGNWQAFTLLTFKIFKGLDYSCHSDSRDFTKLVHLKLEAQKQISDFLNERFVIVFIFVQEQKELGRRVTSG